MTVEVPALVRDNAGISVDELDRHALRQARTTEFFEWYAVEEHATAAPLCEAP